MSDEQQTQPDDLIGARLGQYEILEEIGRGGMATVYRAKQTSINRTVAIKVLPRHFLHDPGFFERFEREVDVIAHLEHPHILPIYDYGKDQNVPYIVMRYLGGGSMAQMIRRGVPKLEALDKPFTQVAQALDHAHRQGIIHRDLKPGNIMLDENGNAYLSDFGIARVLGSNLTGSQIIGTPAYMSPEQANGFPLDARSDIYSLGIVLFEMITGKEPYQAETPMALLLKHINEPIPPLRTYRGDIPDTVENVIRRSTAKKSDDRYASASDMAADFTTAIRQTGQFAKQSPQLLYDDDAATIAPELGSRGRLTPVGAVPRAATAPITAGMSSPGRSSLPLILGGVGVLAVLAIIALVVLPGMNPGEVPVTYVPATPALATPFAQARTIETEDYTISIPREWIPPQGFYDISDDNRLIHVWQPQDLSAYVALLLPTNINITNEASYEQQVADYAGQIYATEREATTDLIEESVAPDGTIRQSYRLFGDTEPPFPPGQLDVFYLNRAPHLAVLEVYSSDATGNDLVTTFQNILDSVQIKPTE